MELKTLAHCTVNEITQAFNEAFSDYIIPLLFTESAMAEKIKTENILLPLSAGAFKDGRLVGFILHGYDLVNDMPTVYNAGTGVIPGERGRAITMLLYDFIIPRLQREGIHHHVLEVISSNKPAIKVYKRLGFVIKRELGVYKKTEVLTQKSELVIKEVEAIDPTIAAWNDCAPSWQNNNGSIARNSNGHKFLLAYEGTTATGYAVYAEGTGRIKQLAVHPQYRKQGTGSALLSYMSHHKQSEALVITNIDLSCRPATAFLDRHGFQPLLTQYEMDLMH